MFTQTPNKLDWDTDAIRRLDERDPPTVATVHVRRQRREIIERMAQEAGLSQVTLGFLETVLANQVRWGWNRIGSTFTEHSKNHPGLRQVERFPGVTAKDKAEFWEGTRDARRADVAVDILVTQLGLPPGARILELGSGYGRVAVRLAEHGFQVTGIEPDCLSVDMARELATLRHMKPDFVCGGAREYLGTVSEPFDAVLSVGCLFAGAGLPRNQDDVPVLLQALARAVRPGGKVLIADCWQFDCCVRGWVNVQQASGEFSKQLWEETEGRVFLLKEWRYVQEERRFYFRTVQLSPGREPEGFSQADWIWTAKAIEEEMRQVGLPVVRTWGSADWGAPEVSSVLVDGSWVSILAERTL